MTYKPARSRSRTRPRHGAVRGRLLDGRPTACHGGTEWFSAAALRALATPPEGLREEAIGGHARTLAHDSSGLYFTPDELALLRPPIPVPHVAFSTWM